MRAKTSWLAVLTLAVALGSPAQAARVRVGEEIELGLETAHPYGLETRAETTLIWSRTVHHPKAVYIAPHFSRFQLAAGDFLVVRSPDGRQSWRYTGLGRADQGLSADGFWSGHIKGDTAIVELYGKTMGDGFGLRIDRYARGLSAREIEEVVDLDPPGSAAICGSDDSEEAKCLLAGEPEIYDRSIAVTRLLISGMYACTGWLVGCEGHMMTNHHCIADQTAANNTDYEFMAEGAICATDCTSWGACPGVIEATSATLVQSSAPYDFALLQLPQSLANKYGYMQLREEGPQLAERIYIPQHPSHWGKRIAAESTHPSDEGLCRVQSLTRPACSTGGGPDVGYYCDTRGGSSGAPVLAYSDHRVVALHHCANCPNRGVNIVDVIERLGSALPLCAYGQFAGTVELNRPVYSCSDLVRVRVQDDSLQEAGYLTVTLRSSTETAPEELLLLETAAGIFTGEMASTGGEVVSGDGELSVQHADEIIVRYVDADDGAGAVNVVVEALAAVDCQAPAISKVDAGEITGNAATIVWNTDENATSVVEHGSSSTDDDLVRKHRLRITGLTECSTQSYSVHSTDAAGNLGSDDNSGLLYELSTGKNSRPETQSGDTPQALPDGLPAGVVSTITVAEDEIVQDVDVVIDVAHPYVQDLTLELIPPQGESILLADRCGGDGADFSGTLFDDEAQRSVVDGTAPFLGAFRPEQPLHSADGISSAGDWSLRVADGRPSDEGTLDSWRLILTYPHQVCGAHAAFRADTTHDDACASGDGGGNGIWEAGERIRFSVRLRNDGDEPLTGVSARVVPLGPGVTMIVDTAFYGEIPVKAEIDAQAPGFAAQLAAGLGCGEQLQFELEITANEGNWSSPFGRILGLPSSFPSLVFDEEFEWGVIPLGWTVVDGGGDGHSWFVDDPLDPRDCGNVDPLPTIGGSWAAVDSDCAGVADLDESLISRTINLSFAEEVSLSFDQYFNHFRDEIADVDVRSSSTGGAWVNVARFTEDSANPETVVLDVTPHAAGVADLQIRWHYHGANFDWFWYVDNVRLKAVATLSCEMTACAAATTVPDPVPDGSAGTQPMRVDREDPQGSRLVITYDDQCAPPVFNLLYGPLEQLAFYSLEGALCSVAHPAVWDPAPSGDVWFLLVGSNGAGTESSWGESSQGERNGLDASGECGALVKDLSGNCP